MHDFVYTIFILLLQKTYKHHPFFSPKFNFFDSRIRFRVTWLFFFFLIYISGLFTMLIYVIIFTGRHKDKVSPGWTISFFVLLYSDQTSFFHCSNLEGIFSQVHIESYFYITLYCLTLLPLMSYIFGPTAACRGNY
jgi:hypothetical protein